MKKVIIICSALFALTSTSVLAGGSKRPPKWPPVVNVAPETTVENHSL